jgi:DNA-binding Lrp family transcriptional regulator
LEGYIVVNADTKRSQYWCITEEAIKIKGVKMAHMVLGGFDAVLYIKFSDSDELKKIISEVTSIPAVERIQTMLALLPKKRWQI